MMTLIALLPLFAPLQEKERSSLLRAAVKSYAAFVEGDREKGIVRLRDSREATWPLDPDAEVRVRGWWGGLEDLVPGERVWVWTRPDREGKPKAVFMIADEISEQDIHQVPYTLAPGEAGTVIVRRKLDGKTEQSRTLKAADLEGVKAGEEVYLQTSGEAIVRIVNAAGLAALKEGQKARLEERWRKGGLPGTVGSLHGPVGEIEVILDHEGMRWGRALKAGDRVKINLEKPVEGSVVEVRPWNERTRVTLAAAGRDLADLEIGHRVRVVVPEPPKEVRDSRLPADADRPREPAARAEWILASTYCSCAISGDVCTGMFYTLAACNSMKCGMPNRVRGLVRPLIEKGLTDKEIFGRMEEELGPSIWKPHLLR